MMTFDVEFSENEMIFDAEMDGSYSGDYSKDISRLDGDVSRLDGEIEAINGNIGRLDEDINGINSKLTNKVDKSELESVQNELQKELDGKIGLDDLPDPPSYDDTEIRNEISDVKEDLSDKVDKSELDEKVGFTDLAQFNKAGVVMLSQSYGLTRNSDGALYPLPRTYVAYKDARDALFISKATLENVLAERLKEPQWQSVSVTIDEEGLRSYDFLIDRQIKEIYVRVYSPILVGYTNGNWYPVLLDKSGNITDTNLFYASVAWSSTGGERYGGMHILNNFGVLDWYTLAGASSNNGAATLQKAVVSPALISDDDFYGVRFSCSSASRIMVGTRFDIMYK